MSKRYFVMATCLYCGKEFSRRKDKTIRYCSRQCVGKAKSQRESKLAICPMCGTEFIKRRSTSVYCSRTCATEGRNKKIATNCEQCGQPIERPPCHIKSHTFCSTKCLGIWNAQTRCGDRCARWNGGKYTNPDGYLFTRQEDGSYRQDHRLEVERHLGRRLTSDEIIHHIDGNKQNNLYSNLMIVTRSEHAKIHKEMKCHQAALEQGVREVSVYVDHS